MYDVAVVGAGIMGAATAVALVERGRSVVLLEQFDFGHARGSSHGRARIFRFSYPDPMYVSMAQESLQLWTHLEAKTGDLLIKTTGGLDTGKGLADHVKALDACGADYEVLDGSELARRIDSIILPPGQEVLYQPQAGVIAADRSHRAFLRVVEEGGGQVRPVTKVVAIEPDADSVSLRTPDEVVEARSVVVTAGAWARELVAAIGIALDVRPTRETVAFFAMEGPFPPTLVEWGDPAGYGLGSPDQGIKVGEHQAGPTVNPDDAGQPDGVSIERLTNWVGQRYPKAESRPHLAETCLYTNAPDDRFILERHERVIVGSPCSGHGFKFAPLIGERLAQLATEIL